MRPALYAVPVPESLDPGKRDELLAVLPPERRARIAGYLRPEKALASLLGEILVRRVLGRELGIPWAAVRIVAGPHGKPVLADHPAPHFNVSDSDGWVVAAFGNRPVGVDVERIRPVLAGVVETALSPEERASLFAGLPGAGKGSDPAGEPRSWRRLEGAASKAFVEHWTLKESYLKLTGVGLAAPLERLTVRQEGTRLAVSPPAPEGDVYCRRYELHPEYALSLCSYEPHLPERVQFLHAGEIVNSQAHFE